ncbi:helix-turn-helix domain-containing protein [Bacillus atrophaeus]|uniref:helix-turn-helix domain-containing protein n=1 Tax=Bacillus atrophaeus TaxID=1452 RepID=UPI00227EED70|nr:helix-turn-helix transcriptional regulator [Bacillus atrophaeus]MCY8826058.1 helix-turn-helix domain-containing protein [Bacillus atrophaeus]MCY8840431.1 helix-turn-helix domain-containing protein [Bacillus atrophaeus]MEC0803581.1 helix-turn-helix transcriptional regulator [Bacillus atrophaeus]MEC0854224.1 helix-turn-helix transcriptional regulator [Bacillus atrophaeus]MEC0857426.1 helix-turn-helix transcriptional regulator [Bacillus atrophaeus]
MITIREREEQQFLNGLGKRIKLLRVSKEWSQERLGFKSNLDRTYIGGIERGEENPSILNLKKIADALEVPIEKIFTENKE